MDDSDSIIYFTPPIIYVVFSIAQFIASFFRSKPSCNHFMYLIIIVIFTNFLIRLCKMKYIVLAWFFALLPIFFLVVKFILVILLLLGD